MSKTIRIGIDPSINCTGVCVWDIDENTHQYFMIPSKMTKKMKEFSNHYVHLVPYNKQQTDSPDYSIKEQTKFDNIYNICKNINNIIDWYEEPEYDDYGLADYNEIEVYMEGVSYGSVGSAALVDLSFLNASIRMILKHRGIKFTIVSPTSLKKFACANGQAEKDIMIDAWYRMDPTISNIKNIKVDDLADSYFLAHYNFAS